MYILYKYYRSNKARPFRVSKSGNAINLFKNVLQNNSQQNEIIQQSGINSFSMVNRLNNDDIIE